ncbi:GntR family transcriptional regulator [Nocardioides currus]|uniref:GntR family transcriptional regulator n=1 Tax=Nocardioides currus TaxID=2133958 RepID=A0A2R7YVE5_9ACTN|nr:GntR family transcriptional regulator [Nocardioides currus]PUA80380.1 GntR family transcriptional regulator [Nocardioides currus]
MTDEPKHRALQRALISTAGRLGPGSPMPSERSLTDTYSISRTTVRKAIDSLVHDGVLERAQGKGTFVSRGRLRSTLHMASFSDDMRRRGLQPSSRLVRLSREQTTGAVAAFFDGSPGWRLERLRLADGDPIALEVDWINADLVTDLDAHDVTGSLYALLATAYDRPVDEAEQTVWATAADPWQAAQLEAPVGAPLMAFERRSRSGGRPIEHVTSWYRGDRYSLQMSLDESMRTAATGEES